MQAMSRLWRSVKYEEVYLRAYESFGEARASIGRYLAFYNCRRHHSSLDDSTPGSSLLQPVANPHGGLTPADAPLIDAEMLFRQPGPAQTTTMANAAIIRFFMKVSVTRSRISRIPGRFIHTASDVKFVR
jgi:hypothetical protein